MTLRVRQWRKRKRELDQLLCYSDSDEEGIENNSNSVPGTSSCSSDGVPRTPDSLSDSVLGASDDFDFDTDLDYSSTDSEQEPNEAEVTSFEDELRQWALEHRLTHRALNGLLPILRNQGHLLPVDCRTLLATPQHNTTESKCGGEYKYYGLEKGICRYLSQMETNDVHLNINVNGIPLFKSSGVQFWPILAKCGHFDPFIVAMFSGQSKPNPLEEYLKDFLTEYKHLKDNGIVFKGQTYTVNIDALICDAPARAYLKCIKGHTAYESCERCLIRGTRVERRIVFSEKEYTSRKDDCFSRVEYSNHQTGISPFIAAGIPCVSSFVLDYMHVVCLGVVRRLLIYLTRGPKVCRLSVRQKDAISEKLIALRGKMPSEFARQPRGLHEIDRWKATELRQFLLYTGPVVLKTVLSPEKYQHFLSLAMSMSIMLESDERTRNAYLQYSQELIKHFVMCCADLYGKTFAVYNVHALIHLQEDASHFNCSLNEISCFPFENYLQQVKKHVRSGRSPLEQVTRRLSEIEQSEVDSSQRHPKVFVSDKEKDSCFLLRDNSFAFVRQKNADGTFACEILRQCHTSPLFQQPCSSGLLNIVCIGNGRVRMKNALLRERDLLRKAACLPQEGGGFVLIPLRHGLEHTH
ncbi:Cell cycle checkpoint protein RAD17 [Labeo rohita]|uniref:Cell cycle checkpoint protein RAD17 n=1 Tax=Labeo rohita TaxID=84645 RepID=A0ABQ8L6I3_LABRO|nr:Cell cycle checkpoint protein RAD17 [Labeo rohita]